MVMVVMMMVRVVMMMMMMMMMMACDDDDDDDDDGVHCFFMWGSASERNLKRLPRPKMRSWTWRPAKM
jgi:hypothetical protein